MALPSCFPRLVGLSNYSSFKLFIAISSSFMLSTELSNNSTKLPICSTKSTLLSTRLSTLLFTHFAELFTYIKLYASELSTKNLELSMLINNIAKLCDAPFLLSSSFVYSWVNRCLTSSSTARPSTSSSIA